MNEEKGFCPSEHTRNFYLGGYSPYACLLACQGLDAFNQYRCV